MRNARDPASRKLGLTKGSSGVGQPRNAVCCTGTGRVGNDWNDHQVSGDECLHSGNYLLLLVKVPFTGKFVQQRVHLGIVKTVIALQRNAPHVRVQQRFVKYVGCRADIALENAALKLLFQKIAGILPDVERPGTSLDLNVF